MKKYKCKGFWACGAYYEMPEKTKPYIEQLKELLKEIRTNALKNNYMKKSLILLLTVLLISCVSRKSEINKTDLKTKDVVTDNSTITTNENSNLKVTNNTETNKETGEETEVETLEPIDNTKPANYIDENGKSQSLNNAKKTKTKTTRKTSEKTKDNTNVIEVKKEAKKQQNAIKIKSKSNVEVKQKQVVSEKGNFWNLILFILFAIAVIWFVLWSRKIVKEKEKLL